MNRLIVTTLDNALRVARKTLYKHSILVLYHAENARTVFTSAA